MPRALHRRVASYSELSGMIHVGMVHGETDC
uniref:Uncharacterized protein n=1 Tax=Arundo donax TaxID=35708 RepID=A0A0A9U9L1_ARUDO